MNAAEFDKAKALATEDERELGIIPTEDEHLLVTRYMNRLNLRGYHNAHSYGSTFDSYLETVWWFEGHSFAEKLVLNGFAMYITAPAAQITFGVLASAVLVMVQVHVNPYMERDVGLLANLLGVATFLLLLVGAHVALVGDGEWTTDAVAVQQAIIACAGACVIAGCLIVVRDTVRNVLRMRDAHIKEWERQNGARASASASASGSNGGGMGFGLLRRIAGVATQASEPSGARPPSASRRRDRSDAAAAATNAAGWAVRQVAGADPTAALPPTATNCLMREVKRRFGQDLLGHATARHVVEQALAARSSPAPAPTMPAGERLAAARACIAAVKAVTTSTLPQLSVPMAELAWRALVPGTKRISVMVRRPAALAVVIAVCTAPCLTGPVWQRRWGGQDRACSFSCKGTASWSLTPAWNTCPHASCTSTSGRSEHAGCSCSEATPVYLCSSILCRGR